MIDGYLKQTPPRDLVVPIMDLTPCVWRIKQYSLPKQIKLVEEYFEKVSMPELHFDNLLMFLHILGDSLGGHPCLLRLY